MEIAVIDDEVRVLSMLTDVLQRLGHSVRSFDNPELAVEELLAQPADVVITDLRMREMSGMDVMQRLHERAPDTIVMIMTAFGSLETAMDAIRNGAFDYISKPFQFRQLEIVLEKAAAQLKQQVELKALRREAHKQYQFQDLVGKSRRMQEVFALISTVARYDSTVLIRGNSGTGKELVARAIHARSERVDQPFVVVSCSAIPETLLESELFGHTRGAFTGAISDRKGVFQEAEQGTIFLDEVGDLTPAVQLKLLRVLQERTVRPVGSDQSLAVDVRVIAATHHDLEEAMREGRFRQDLFYRLNVIPIFLPDLKDRPDDIPLLIEHFLEKYAKEFHRELPRLNREVLQQLIIFSWPGNVRQLENLMARLVVLYSPGRLVTSQDLPLEFQAESKADVRNDIPPNLTLAAVEKIYIQRVLATCGGQRQKAAEILDIDRRTLYRKLKEYELE